jgi:hypothetical protein
MPSSGKSRRVERTTGWGCLAVSDHHVVAVKGDVHRPERDLDAAEVGDVRA